MSITRRANPHGLTAKAPLRLHLRCAFHDWMWNGGGKEECGWRRRLARRLPLYFSDPDMDGLPKTPKQWAKFDAEHDWQPTLGPQDITSTWPVTTTTQTWASGVGTTYTYRQP